MRVPEGAGVGQAKITLSFVEWKEGKVAPARVTAPVEAAEAQADAKDKK